MDFKLTIQDLDPAKFFYGPVEPHPQFGGLFADAEATYGEELMLVVEQDRYPWDEDTEYVLTVVAQVLPEGGTKDMVMVVPKNDAGTQLVRLTTRARFDEWEQKQSFYDPNEEDVV